MGEKALANPEARGFLAEMCQRYQTDEATLWRVVKRTCLKPNKAGDEPTDEQVIVYLMVCRRYDLNPLLKEMQGFVDRHGQLVFAVGIDGWLKIANRHPQYAGMDVQDHLDENHQPESCTTTVWRKDRKQPTSITEWLSECKRDTEPWRTRPVRMLRHKATIQAIRYAFAITGLTDIEEAMEAVRFANGLPLGQAESRTEAINVALDQHPALQAAEVVEPIETPTNGEEASDTHSAAQVENTSEPAASAPSEDVSLDRDEPIGDDEIPTQ